jgi:hypothetical protein
LHGLRIYFARNLFANETVNLGKIDQVSTCSPRNFNMC